MEGENIFSREKKFSPFPRAIYVGNRANKKEEADVVNFPGISNQLFAAIDADKGDDTNQNHCTGGTEADDVFQILRAIFFETHFFCLHDECFFQPRNL